jgi:hypothetical protein
MVPPSTFLHRGAGATRYNDRSCARPAEEVYDIGDEEPIESS